MLLNTFSRTEKGKRTKDAKVDLFHQKGSRTVRCAKLPQLLVEGMGGQERGALSPSVPSFPNKEGQPQRLARSPKHCITGCPRHHRTPQLPGWSPQVSVPCVQRCHNGMAVSAYTSEGPCELLEPGRPTVGTRSEGPHYSSAPTEMGGSCI